MKTAFLTAFAVVGLQTWAQEHMILHVTQPGGGFSTDVVLRNNLGASLPYHLIAYDSGGGTLAEVEGTVGPLASVRLSTDDLFDVAGVSHFAKSDDTLVSMSVSYHANFEGAGIANVLETATRSDLWFIQPGLQQLSWDGVAMVNRSAEATPIWVDQRDEQGDLVKSVQIHPGLEPNAKALYVLSADFDLTYQNALFQIAANQPIAVMALRGTPSNAVLWQNLAQPAPLDRAPAAQDFEQQTILFRNDADDDMEWVFPDGPAGTARNRANGQNGPYKYTKTGRNSMTIELELASTHLFRMGFSEDFAGLYQEWVDGELADQGSFWTYP